MTTFMILYFHSLQKVYVHRPIIMSALPHIFHSTRYPDARQPTPTPLSLQSTHEEASKVRVLTSREEPVTILQAVQYLSNYATHF